MEEEILKYFADLKYKDQQNLYSKLTFLLKKNNKHNTNEIMLYKYLVEKIARTTGEQCVSFPLFKKTNSYSEFKKNISVIDNYLLKALKQDSVQKQTQLKFYRLCIDLVIEDMEQKEITLYTRSVIRFLKNVPALINNSFPGYARSGLFEAILKNM